MVVGFPNMIFFKVYFFYIVPQSLNNFQFITISIKKEPGSMNWGLAKLYTSSKYLPMHTAYSAAVVEFIKCSRDLKHGLYFLFLVEVAVCAIPYLFACSHLICREV